MRLGQLLLLALLPLYVACYAQPVAANKADDAEKYRQSLIEKARRLHYDPVRVLPHPDSDRVTCWQQDIEAWTMAAVDACSRILAQESDYNIRAQILAQRSKAYIRDNKPEPAIADCTEAINIDSSIPDCFLYRGIAYLDRGDIDLSMSDLNGVVSLFGKKAELTPTDSEKLAYTLTVRCRLFSRKSDIDKALGDCAKALKLNDRRDTHIFLARLYAKSHQVKAAFRELEKGTKHREFHNDREIVEDLFYTDMRLNERGVLYDLAGKYGEAIREYTKAIETHPKDADIYLNRAWAYRHKGDFVSAVADAKKSLELDPASEDTRQLVDELEKMTAVTPSETVTWLSTPQGYALDSFGSSKLSNPNEDELVVTSSPDGHFRLDALVNGVAVLFLVDTGATSTVLTATDAARVGVDLSKLSFNQRAQTANGQTFFAVFTLQSLEIGPCKLTATAVVIAPKNLLTQSLLGMDTINRFGRIEIEGHHMRFIVPHPSNIAETALLHRSL